MDDFGALPPEINSARMYTGPGPAPLLASAAAWDALAAELESFALGYTSTLAELQGPGWSGAASSAMAAAAAPFVTWAATTAGQAEDAAGQARAAASAYEVAFAATVPPALVIANRMTLAALVATNFFGQNTPAIAATEAAYAEMWAQDAAAMYGYAASASAAATLTAFGAPPQTTSPVEQSSASAAGGQAGTSSAANAPATLSQLTSAAPLSGAVQPDASAPATTIIDAVAPIAALDAGLDSTILGYEIPKTLFQGGSYFLAAQRTGTQDSDLPKASTAPGGAATTTRGWSQPEPAEPVRVEMGRSDSVGGMSVPQNWTAATAAAESGTQPTATSDQGSRALPPWAGSEPKTAAGLPAAGRVPAGNGRRQSNAVFRMRDRRYRIPRPPLGG